MLTFPVSYCGVVIKAIGLSAHSGLDAEAAVEDIINDDVMKDDLVFTGRGEIWEMREEKDVSTMACRDIG